MQKILLTLLMFASTMVNVNADKCPAFPIDDSWNPVTDINNHTLSGFMQREELSHCYDQYTPPNILKLMCYYKEDVFYVSTVFCVLLSSGIMCL